MKKSIQVVFESEWVLEDDNVTERKDLIGQSDKGFHYGNVNGFPNSTPFWSTEAFSSIELARNGRVEAENKLLLNLCELEKEVNLTFTDF